MKHLRQRHDRLVGFTYDEAAGTGAFNRTRYSNAAFDAALTKALVNREAIQGTLMRSTIHTVSRADYPVLLAGVRSARRDWWLRVVQHQAHGLDMEAVAGIVRERLSRGPARAAELKTLLASSRRIVVPLLERLDRDGVTRRDGDRRRLP